jgi:hypothetical protein
MMMTYKPPVVFLGLGLIATVLPLLAEEGFAQSFEVTSTERVNFPPNGTIRINGSYGYLSVDGWDEPQVEVTITKSTDRFYKPAQQEEAKRRLERIRVVTERRTGTELSITTVLAARHGTWSPPLKPTTKAGVTVDCWIHVPRDSRLVIHHDTGYLWVSDVTGDIEARSHTGDMILMLATPGQYSIDARNRIGSIISDFAGAHNQFVVGTRFVRAGDGPSRRVYLRMGCGNITIKQMPPPWPPTND